MSLVKPDLSEITIPPIFCGCLREKNTHLEHLGCLPFTRENRKVQLENQMVDAIPFGKLQKIWAVIGGDAIFLLFEVSLADVDIFYSDFLSRNTAFNCFMFTPEISNRMVFVNGKHPLTILQTDTIHRGR